MEDSMNHDVQNPVDVDEAPTEPAVPTGPDGPAEVGPPPGPAEPPRPGRARQFLTGAVVGGLCGALVAGGAFLVADDDGDAGGSAVPSRESPVVRESSTIGENGDIAGIIARVQPAVVTVTTGTAGLGGAEGAGTGFVIAADGVIVTNNHVVADADEIEVAFPDGQTFDASVTGTDDGADLAVLDIDASGLPVAELCDSDNVQVGDEVVAIGNALGLEGGLTVTRGIISGPPREIGTEIGTQLRSVLQTDAAINRGNSGGPLVDAAGCVIGINTAIADPAFAQNVGFAIPTSLARPIIEDLRAGRQPAFLGVATETVTPQLVDELGLETDSGAVVTDVTEGSPADDAGIRVDDVIVELAGDAIDEAGDVPAAIRQHRPGDEIEVALQRGGERVTVNATLVERPDSQ
jgi:S1-C subfamily serine protease